MPKKKEPKPVKRVEMKAHFEGAGSVRPQRITDILETNFMPYAMSVIVSRAIPEIDGFKPAHRKLLYTMYKMNLLSGTRTKSANVVGQTMRLNPHGDQAIYETMVRMSRGNEALLYPYVDSKGNFGKSYSRDMAYAASRYTEVKLAPICAELFKDIDQNAVDFSPNYDNTTNEPVLLPSRFPSVLVNATMGLAVGMTTTICSFNLEEVCETTIGLLKDPEFDLHMTLKAPDFPGGGFILYDEKALDQLYQTGRGAFVVRSKYHYDSSAGCIEVTEIPPTTTVEAIIDKIAELIKAAKIREISDIRDETDLSGLKLTIDIKRGVDPDKLMKKLFRMTTLQDSYNCIFNILIGGTPQVMGVREILSEWIAFREECVRRKTGFELDKKKEKLHLLLGLAKILLDIDKAVRIVRETAEESEVVPNLMIGFGIDRAQAEYVAEIKLRHFNREFILKRTGETDTLKDEIAQMEKLIGSRAMIRDAIARELREIVKKYAIARKSMLIYPEPEEEGGEQEEELPDYPVNLFFTKEGYFKKITPQSYRMGSTHKLKETDEIARHLELTNNCELLFFTDKGQVYKARARDFEETKASALGDFVPARLGFDPGESAVYMAATQDFEGYMLFFFANGKIAKIPMKSYETKTNRKKLSGAYNTLSPVVGVLHILEEGEFLLTSSQNKALLVHSGAVAVKSTRSSQGVGAMTLRKGAVVETVRPYTEDFLEKSYLYRAKNLPAAGKTPSFSQEQIVF